VEPTEIDVLLSAGPSRKSCKVSVPGGATLRWEASRGGLLENGRPVAGPRAAAEDGRGFTLDGTRYPGSLSATVAPGGALVLRNRVALDAYLEGVLAGELYPDAPPEALRAQAVLARSFALANLEGLTDDPMLHQAYRGVPPASSAALVRDAVRGTAGLRLLDAAGNPLPGYWYHSTCGGHTADAALVFGVPPSAACAGTACGKCGTSKYARWETEVTEREMRKALGFGSPVATLEVGSRSADGRVLAFRAATAAGTVRRVPAIDLRRALGPNRMRSTLVGEVEEVREPGGGAPRAFVLRGRGWGHGVGLCQIGACTLAREGRTAAEILALYFPGSRLVRAAR
jgi:stage II sporulation protein D